MEAEEELQMEEIGSRSTADSKGDVDVSINEVEDGN